MNYKRVIQAEQRINPSMNQWCYCHAVEVPVTTNTLCGCAVLLFSILMKLLRYERKLVVKNGKLIKRRVEKSPAFDAGILLSLIEYSQWIRRTVKKLVSGFQETVRKRGFFNVRLLNDFLNRWIPGVNYRGFKERYCTFVHYII